MDPAYGQAKAGRPARTYIRQLCEDTGCSPEDLPEAMNDREKWRERVRDIRASGTTWWWWWWWFTLFTYLEKLSSFVSLWLPRIGSDTRTIIKRSRTCFNSEISFSYIGCLTHEKEITVLYNLFKADLKTWTFMRMEKQTIFSRN